jgi:hypothetical protein
VTDLRTHGIAGLQMSDHPMADRVVVVDQNGNHYRALRVDFKPSPRVTDGGCYTVTIQNDGIPFND